MDFTTSLHLRRRFPSIHGYIEPPAHSKSKRQLAKEERDRKRSHSAFGQLEKTANSGNNNNNNNHGSRYLDSNDLQNLEKEMQKQQQKKQQQQQQQNPVWKPVNGWTARREIKSLPPMKHFADEPSRIVCVVREEKADNYVTIAPFVPTGPNGAVKERLVNKAFLCAPESVSAGLLPPSFLHHLTRQYMSPLPAVDVSTIEIPGITPVKTAVLSPQSSVEMRPSKRVNVLSPSALSGLPAPLAQSVVGSPGTQQQANTEQQIKQINQRLQHILRHNNSLVPLRSVSAEPYSVHTTLASSSPSQLLSSSPQLHRNNNQHLSSHNNNSNLMSSPLPSSPARGYAQNVTDSSPLHSMKTFRKVMENAVAEMDKARHHHH